MRFIEKSLSSADFPAEMVRSKRLVPSVYQYMM
jgi:hypothetical protein